MIAGNFSAQVEASFQQLTRAGDHRPTTASMRMLQFAFLIMF